MTSLICPDGHDLYVEEYERFHGEPDGDYVVMCSTCGWTDKYVYYVYDAAMDRKEALKRDGLSAD